MSPSLFAAGPFRNIRLFALLLGVAILLHAASTAAHVLAVGGDFYIDSNRLVCEMPLNNRCMYVQHLVDAKGQITVADLSYITQVAALSSGDTFSKMPMSFFYQFNGIKHASLSFVPVLIQLAAAGFLLAAAWLSGTLA